MNPTHHKPTILVVNDKEATLELFRKILGGEGYTVVTATSYKRALELASSIAPGIIIADLELSEMGGLEFCHRLKKHPSMSLMPVLLVSAPHFI